MKSVTSFLIAGITCAALGLFAETKWGALQAQESSYLVIMEWKTGPDMSRNEGTAQLSEWVRALRETGKHSSVRLYSHHWGPNAAFYIVLETTNWGAIDSVFADIAATQPDIKDRALGFAGHSDNILTEIPVSD